MVMGVLNKVRSRVNGALGNSNVSGATPETLQISHFFDEDVDIKEGKENVLGEYVIGAQQQRALGFGSPEFSDNQGVIFMDLKKGSNDDGTDDIEGEIILSIQDYNGNSNRVVYRGQLVDLRSGEGDITKRVKFPLVGIWGRENDKIVLKIKPKESVTVSVDDCKALVASSVIYTGQV